MTSVPASAATPDARRMAMAMLLASAVAFGANAPFARLSGLAHVSGGDIVTMRVLLMLAGLALYARLVGVPLTIPRAERGGLMALGIASAFVGASYLSAVSFIPVGVAAMVLYLYPLLILIATPLVDRTRPPPAVFAIFALAFVGLALGLGASFEHLDPRGLALAGLAAVAAMTQIFAASRAPGGGGVATIFWLNVVILPVAIGFSLVSGGPPTLGALRAAAAPVTITVLLYVVGMILQIRGMRLVSAARAGLILCLEPIVAMASAALWIGERLAPVQYAGAALVIVAVALSIAAPGLRRPAT